MRGRTVQLDARSGEPWRIYVISDTHIGDANCDELALRSYIERIHDDPHGRLVITGDLISAIGKGDKRLDLSSLADWVLERKRDIGSLQDILGVQADQAANWLAPVANRLDGMVSGNHESKPRAWYGRDIMGEIAKTLGCADAYLGAYGWLTHSYTVTATQRRRLDVLLHHGISAGRTVGPQANMLEQVLLDNDCDIAISGHSHKTVIHSVPQVRRDPKSGAIVERQRWAIIAGTFQRTPTGADLWADERRLRPARIGGVRIEYDPVRAVTQVAA